MVRIRLTRIGRKNAPAYRIVAADRKAKRDGKNLEVIGHYNPTENPNNIVYKKERYKYWLSVGAEPSAAVKKLVSGNYKYIKYNPNGKKDADTEAKISEPASTDISETETKGDS